MKLIGGLIFIGLIVLYFVFHALKSKADEALEKHVFSRHEYAAQQTLLGHHFLYRVPVERAKVLEALGTYVLGEGADFTGLSVIERTDDYLVYGFSAVHLSMGAGAALSNMAAGRYEFEAAVTLTPPDVVFFFRRCKTSDGVVRNIEDMQKLKDRIETAMNALSPGVQPTETTA